MVEIFNNPPAVVLGGGRLASTVPDAHLVLAGGGAAVCGPVGAGRGRCSVHPSCGMFEEPVRVSEVAGEEVLVYNASRMEQGRTYEVSWKGCYYALRRSADRVRLFKFYPDEDGA
ncbi:MAG: hypothetical protein MPI95_04095 [Nitrosopumilus sp.]|nr:hypothetical protein [Nitrosopumilus sp.]MDA7943706.1 hypothetical protein [Nitrosopumilus sp.]MDA7953420.1 hypothetical protein [Nitrosopumilus sp.]MDA7958258.1 hypothetical protein [Nitrosopumilus sp.]MDA7999111.1 hypothetical protein [Nitrosopumilus sp.]